MAVTFRADPAAANQSSPHTLDPSSDPAADAILIAVGANSATAEASSTTNTIGSNTMGGTWTQEHDQFWAGRRQINIWVNDDWTTATGSVAITKGGNQDFADCLIIVEGVESYTEDVSTIGIPGGGSGDWTPTLTGGTDAQIAIIQSEDNETVPVPTDWVSLGSVNDNDGLRTLTIHYHIGALTDTTPTWNFAAAPGFSGWTAHFVAAEEPEPPTDVALRGVLRSNLRLG